MLQHKTFFLLCICSFLLSGCWDRVEVNDLAYVIATGFDKLEENKFQVSVQVPLPGAMGGEGSSGGGGGTSGGPYYVDSGIGRNVRESNDDLQQRMSRRLYFAHRRVLVLGEELARGGFKKTLDVVLEQPESRLSAYVLLTHGDAIHILNATPHFEKLPAEGLREMAKMGVGLTVKDLMVDIERPGKDSFVPVVETATTQNAESEDKKEEIKINEFGILSDDKLKFFTTAEETLGLLWLINEAAGNNYTFKVGDKDELNVNIQESKIRPSYNKNEQKPSFSLKIDVKAKMMQNEPALNLDDEDIYESVKAEMEKQIKEEILALLDHSHKEGSDIYGFGWYLFRHEHRQWEDWKDDWASLLADLEVNVEVEAEIKKTINPGIEIGE